MKKNRLALFFAALGACLFGCASVPNPAPPAPPEPPAQERAAVIYVAEDGADGNAGTRDAPVGTLARAIELAGELTPPDAAEAVVVELKEGRYEQSETLVIDKTVSAKKPVVVRGEAGKTARVSGGQRVTGWEAYRDGIYKTNVGAGKLFRQLYVGGRPGIRARYPDLTPEGDKNLSIETEKLSWDGDDEGSGLGSSNNPDPTISRPSDANDGLFDDADVPGIEAHVLSEWSHNILRPQSKTVSGGRMHFTVTALDRTNIFKRWWPRRLQNAPVWFENSLKFLNAENEWHYDKATGGLYYKPVGGINIDTAEIFIPAVETLLKIKGGRSTAAQNKRVRNLTFENLVFEHTGWEYPSKYGLADQQSGQYQLGAKPDENGEPTGQSFEGFNSDVIEGALGHPPAAVWVEWAQNVRFDRCVIRNAGSTGLDFYMGVKDCGITNSALGYIAGNGISMGYYNEYAYATGADAAAAGIDGALKTATYNPSNKEEVSQSLTVENCYVTRAGCQYLFGSAIMSGYTKNVAVKNNTVTQVPFGGVQMGWGWSAGVTPMGGFDVLNNAVDGAMNSLFHDNGDIYFLGMHSAAEKTSNVKGNYVTHSLSSYAPIYLDMHSTEFLVEDNVLDNQYVDNQMYLYYHNMNQALKNLKVGINFVRNDRVQVNNGAVLPSQNIDYPITWAYVVPKAQDWPSEDITAQGKTYNIQGIIDAAGVPAATLASLKNRL
jgi:hypothetical protein